MQHCRDRRRYKFPGLISIGAIYSASALGHSRRSRTASKRDNARHAAESGSKFRALAAPRKHVIQASQPVPRIMRNEFSDYERTAIKPMLPNKPREVRRVTDRCFVTPVACAMQSIRKLSASLGAPGPHAVRLGHVRLTRRVHRIPAPRVVTIGRNVPLHRGGMRKASFSFARRRKGQLSSKLARRAVCAWRVCGECPSGKRVHEQDAAVTREQTDGGSVLRRREPINRPSWRLAGVRYAPAATGFHIAAK
jgi:hypothetical protein